MPSQDVLSARFSILIRHVGLMLKQHIPDAPMWQRSKMRLSHSRFLRPSGFMLRNAKKTDTDITFHRTYPPTTDNDLNDLIYFRVTRPQNLLIFIHKDALFW